MINEAKKIIAYERPEIEVVDIKMDSLVCQSPGSNEDNTDDEL